MAPPVNVLDAFFKLALPSKMFSTLKLVGSASVEANGSALLTVSVTSQKFIIKDTANDATDSVFFTGPGVGVGFGTPVGGSASSESMPSVGGTLVKGPTCFGKLKLSDLTGPAIIVSAAAGALCGIYRAFIFFGCYTPTPVLCKAWTTLDGCQLSSKGAGIMFYQGLISH